jgi:hypothetical protein
MATKKMNYFPVNLYVLPGICSALRWFHTCYMQSVQCLNNFPFRLYMIDFNFFHFLFF